MAENLSVNVSKGIQPKKGVPPPSFDEHYRVTKVGDFTEKYTEVPDTSLSTSLVGMPPLKGHTAIDPSEEHSLSSVRGFRAMANALGGVYEGNRSSMTITITGLAGDLIGSRTYVRYASAYGTTVNHPALVEGVDWNIVPANIPATATALAAAIAGLAGVGAAAVGAVITVTRDATTRWFDVRASYGTDATIAELGAFYHEARPSALGKDKRYLTGQNSLNQRPTTAMDLCSNGFTIAGGEGLMMVTDPLLGTNFCGAQHRPTATVGPTTGKWRPFVTGRTGDKDSAALLYEVQVGTGGVVPEEEGVALTTLQTRLVTVPAGAWGPARYCYLDKKFKIQTAAGADTGLCFVLPRAAATIQIVTPANCSADTVTITVTSAAGATATVLTEGIDWFADSYTAAVAARSLKDAINLLVDGVVADVISDTVHVHRLWTTTAYTTTAITIATTAGAEIVLSTETASNTLTAADTWTVSTRETEATPSIVSDTQLQLHSLALVSTRFDGLAWRIKPRSVSLAFVRKLNEGEWVATDDARQDFPQGDHIEIKITFVLRVEDRQYLSLMARDVTVNEIYFEWEGDLVGSSGERERVAFTLPKHKILPFVKSIDKPFEDVETVITQAWDTAIGTNDVIEFRWVNAIRSAKP